MQPQLFRHWKKIRILFDTIIAMAVVPVLGHV